MVNIAGRKFLVIPRADIELDSPPPSPPLPPPPSARQGSTIAAKKLPVLLEPVVDNPVSSTNSNTNIPRFEVEQLADGQLLLKPVGGAGVDPTVIFWGHNLNKSMDSSCSSIVKNSRTGTASMDIHTTLSSGFFALLRVFYYLNVQDRLRAARVCKLWSELALHPSLWQTVSLKNVKVYNWERFASLLRRLGSRGVDMRKIVFIKDRDSTWSDILSVAPSLFQLTHIQLPRLSGAVLAQLVTACPQLEVINSPLTISPMDTRVLEKLTNLKELRLKTGNGNLRLDSGLDAFESLSKSLTNLSLLTVTGLSDRDYDCIGRLANLEQIELGDCTDAPVTIFKTLSDLLKLERVRMEKGAVGENISKLQRAESLYQLELIDFLVLPGFREGLNGFTNIRRLLIIPVYKDEVARSNTEIVEGVTTKLKHLDAFYLGVTNEWLQAMAMVIGDKQQAKKAPGDRECFPLEKDDRVEYISLPGLYRKICREMPTTKVKVLKMSAGATCKQFIRSLDK